MMKGLLLAATAVLLTIIPASAERSSSYPRDYFVQVATRKFTASKGAIRATGCVTLASSDKTGHFLLSCNDRRAARALKRCGFKNILDVSEDTLPKPEKLRHRLFRSKKQGASLFKRYSSVPLYPFSWHLRAIGADRAWKRGFNGAGVTVATINNRPGGTYCGHPALARSVIVSKAFSFTNETACVDPFKNGTTSFLAQASAGLVVAKDANYTGVAPGAKFFPVRMEVTDDDAAYVVALLYAAANGADIINGIYAVSDTNRTNVQVVRMYRAAFRAVERLGSLLVAAHTYSPVLIKETTFNRTRDGTILTYGDMGRSVVVTRSTQHSREWCPIGDYSALYPMFPSINTNLKATCGNASYVNQYTNRRPYSGFNPRHPDTPLAGDFGSDVGRPQLCAPGGLFEPATYKACGNNCTQAVYNEATAFFPVLDDTSNGYFLSLSYLNSQGVTSGAAALLLQAYPELKGRPYALRQLLLAAGQRSSRATKPACGAGFLNLRRIFG